MTAIEKAKHLTELEKLETENARLKMQLEKTIEVLGEHEASCPSSINLQDHEKCCSIKNVPSCKLCWRTALNSIE